MLPAAPGALPAQKKSTAFLQGFGKSAAPGRSRPLPEFRNSEIQKIRNSEIQKIGKSESRWPRQHKNTKLKQFTNSGDRPNGSSQSHQGRPWRYPGSNQPRFPWEFTAQFRGMLWQLPASGTDFRAAARPLGRHSGSRHKGEGPRPRAR